MLLPQWWMSLGGSIHVRRREGNTESCLTQDEHEGRPRFSRKVSMGVGGGRT